MGIEKRFFQESLAAVQNVLTLADHHFILKVSIMEDGYLIMVIEDDHLVLEALQLSLEEFGYQVAGASSFNEALTTVHKCYRQPDLILADYGLPEGRTGSEAIHRLRLELGKPVPAILLTGETMPSRLRELKHTDFNLLHKPIRSQTLKEAIEGLLRGVRLGG